MKTTPCPFCRKLFQVPENGEFIFVPNTDRLVKTFCDECVTGFHKGFEEYCKECSKPDVDSGRAFMDYYDIVAENFQKNETTNKETKLLIEESREKEIEGLTEGLLSKRGELVFAEISEDPLDIDLCKRWIRKYEETIATVKSMEQNDLSDQEFIDLIIETAYEAYNFQ